MHISVFAFLASVAAIAVFAASATDHGARQVITGCFYICPATTTTGTPLASNRTVDGTLVCAYSGGISQIVIVCDYNSTTGVLEGTNGLCEPKAQHVCA